VDDREPLAELRSLVVRGDHAGLVATLSRAPAPPRISYNGSVGEPRSWLATEGYLPTRA
jgi:hypothetical protein